MKTDNININFYSLKKMGSPQIPVHITLVICNKQKAQKIPAMQFNQPYFLPGPPQCPQFLPCSSPVPQQFSPSYPDVIGEGEITTVIMPDGTIQHYFLPIYKWPHFMQNANLANCNPYWNPASGAWFIRGISNSGQQLNTPFGYQRPNFPCTSNFALTPPGFQVKFHNDGGTSTTDLSYFYPRSRVHNLKMQSCAGVQVRIPEVRDSPCQHESGDAPEPAKCPQKTENSNTQTNKVICECHKDRDKHCRKDESPMSVDENQRNRTKLNDCEYYQSSDDMSIDQESIHGKKCKGKGNVTYDGTTSLSSICSACLDEKRIESIKKEQKKQEEKQLKLAQELRRREKSWLQKLKFKEKSRRKKEEKSLQSTGSDEDSGTCYSSFKFGDSSSRNTMSTDVKIISSKNVAQLQREKDLYMREQEILKKLEVEQKKLHQEQKRIDQEKMQLDKEKRKLEKEQNQAKAKKSSVTICKCFSPTNSNQKADSYVSAMCLDENTQGSNTEDCSELINLTDSRCLSCTTCEAPLTSDNLVDASTKQSTPTRHACSGVFPLMTYLSEFPSYKFAICHDNASEELCTQTFIDNHFEFD